MQEKVATIRFGVVGGVWEVGGVDRKRGIVPENDTYTCDKWGPSVASFDLRRDPGAIWPDLKAFTPVEVDIGGVRRWAGRIKETPTRDGADAVINVQCEGWQYHLDDDVYDATYIHTKLDGFKDMRSTPGATLGAAALFAAGNFTQDQGLYLALANGSVVAAGCAVACILDLGPNSSFRRVVVDWEASNNASSVSFIAYGSDQPTNAYPTGSFDALWNVPDNSGTAGTSSASTTIGRRYLHLFLLNGTFNGTLAADIWFRVKACRVFASTAYESGGQSILKTPAIVSDALANGTVLLNSDRSKIDAAAAATFNIPDFDPDGFKSTREVWEAANAFENFTSKIDEYLTPVLKTRTTAPQVEIGAWPGSQFEDASANSTEQIYNRVIVQGATADGTPVAIARTAGQLAGSASSTPSVAPANPSAAVNTAGWAALLGTLSRDTSIFDTTPASFKVTGSGQVGMQGDMTGTFTRGVTYTLTFTANITAGDTSAVLVLKFGDPATGDMQTVVRFYTGAFFPPYSIAWTPALTTTNGKLQATLYLSTTATATLNVDSLALSQSSATVVDRTGFRRTMILPVQAALTDVVAARIGDLWLPEHQSTPLKGTVTVAGDGAVRDMLIGTAYPPEGLLQKTDELIRLSHRVDPDTGGFGRDARVAEVTFTSATDSASVTLDNTRTNFDALLARLAVVTGQA